MNSNDALRASLIVAMASILCAPAQAIVVTGTQDTTALINALLAGGGTGIVVTSVTLAGHTQTIDLGIPGLPPTAIMSSGTYTNVSGTYGLGDGILLSTGGVAPINWDNVDVFPGYGDSNNSVYYNSWAWGGTYPVVIDPENPTPGTPATAAQEALLDPITGSQNHYDVTELVITFDMQPGYDHVAFNVVFGSEEYPEFVNSTFIDGFGMYLNGANIATVDGLPVNIQHPWMTDLTGTELDGVLAPDFIPVLRFSGPVNPTGNTLRFIVADTFDAVYDTVVYVSSLNGLSLASDLDADGVADVQDNCPQTANTNQLNSDGDERGDVCDNCTLVANTTQLDADYDGYGNICDADLNNSGLTTSTDFNLLRSVINQPATASDLAAAADMNSSGLVTSTDFNLLRARLNGAPGPSGLACAGSVPCLSP